MRKNYNYPDTKYDKICDICKSTFSVPYNTYRQKNPNKIWRCPSCMKKYRAELLNKRINDDPIKRSKVTEAAKQYAKSLTEEEKVKRYSNLSQKQKEHWNSLSDEEKERIRQYQSDKMKTKWASMSDEEKERFSLQAKLRWETMDDVRKKEHGQRTADRWNSYTKEQQQAITNKRMKTLNNRSDEEKANHYRKIKNFWSNMSPEDFEKHRQQCKIVAKKYWDSLTNYEKDQYSLRASEHWNSLSDEEKERIRQYHIDNNSIKYIQKWYNQLSSDEICDFHKKILISNHKNRLTIKFEKIFNNASISNQYYINPEVLTKHETSHYWDYGIYDRQNNNLVMVVDLDGDFFHANKCDYNGLHSREEYDEKRSLSVPDNVKIFIIQECLFSKSFELMIKTLITNYDEYIQLLFDEYRRMPFPEPRYSAKELCNSFIDLKKMSCDDKYHDDISINTRLGDRMINHFHHSIYHAKCKGSISPYDAWYDDKLLMKCIKNRIIYQRYLNPNKILQGFNICKLATKVSVFSAGRAKLIIHKYLNEFDTIFDPFSGFSGRMLGTMSLGKQYIGQDISIAHVNESNNMIHFLSEYFTNCNASINCANILDSYGIYECLFTCPPYSDKEQWFDVPVDNRSCDDWIDICLSHFKCKRYVFVVDNSIKYKDYIVDEIINKSHFGSNSEKVIVINMQ